MRFFRIIPKKKTTRILLCLSITAFVLTSAVYLTVAFRLNYRKVATLHGADIFFVRSNESLSARTPEIIPVVDHGLKQINKILPVQGMEVYISTDDSLIIPEWSLGGHSINDNDIEIALGPEKLNQDRVTYILAHEIHHCYRSKGPRYGTSLLQVLVSEGTADHFAVKVSGLSPPPWSTALSGEELLRISRMARSELNNTPFDRGRWLFGSDQDIPKWAGYTLGFALFERYVEDYPNSIESSHLIKSEPFSVILFELITKLEREQSINSIQKQQKQ